MEQDDRMGMGWGRFAGMIVTATIIMFFLMNQRENPRIERFAGRGIQLLRIQPLDSPLVQRAGTQRIAAQLARILVRRPGIGSRAIDRGLRQPTRRKDRELVQ